MLRDFLATTVILLTSVTAFAADGANTLTGKTLINGKVVTVGDLFTNTGRNADHALAPAPEVGQKLILTKADLERVAKAFHLDWSAPADISVALERDAVSVTEDDAVQALAQSDLQGKIASDASFAIKDFGQAIILDGQDIPELAVTNTSYDPATERFAATLQISRKGEVVKELSLNGVATAVAQVPVLLNPLGQGAVISAADLKEIQLPKKALRGDVILSKDELLGMMPKRSMAAGIAINRSDVTPPLLVKRNELVTVIYNNGPIRLSAKARSLSSGTRGDTVTLMNANSKKPFDAIITGPQQAEVNVAEING